MAKQKREQKAILLPISDDGDPFEIGDMVGFDGWDSMTAPGRVATVGSAFLGIIRAISGMDATVEYLDINMQPRGDTCVRPLSSLREYIMPGSATEATLPAVAATKGIQIEITAQPRASWLESAEYKTISMSTTSIDNRTVDGIAGVFGNVDDKGDIAHPGVFTRTIQENMRRIRFLWEHDFTQPPTARIDELKEIGRDQLPAKIRQDYPEATGGLLVRRTYLDTPRGNEILAGVKAGAIDEMSYGFNALQVDRVTREGKSIRNLRQARLLDISDVQWGANSATMAKKGSLPYQSTPTASEDAAWGSDAEITKADIAELKAMCAWADPDDKESKSSYKLAHHRADDGHTVVWAGVQSAMNGLMSGSVDIPEADRKSVYDHLAKHYEQFSKEPPDYKMLEIVYSVKAARSLMLIGVNFKAGRMISAVNEAKIREVINALGNGLEQLEDLLGAAEPPAEESQETDVKALTDPAYLLALLDLDASEYL